MAADLKSLAIFVLSLLLVCLLSYDYQSRQGVFASSSEPSTRYADDHRHSKCRPQFVRYESSPWEAEWMQNIHLWQSPRKNWPKGCNQMRWRVNSSNYWLDTLAKRRATRTIGSCDPAVFSRFIFNDSCTGKVKTTYIEPLVGFLRHPLLHCVTWHRGMLYDKSYLMLPFKEEVGYTGQVFFFDAGASTYDDGVGGASQQWFVDEYENFNISVDRLLAYESTKRDPADYWSHVPIKVKPRLTYYNIPVVGTPGADDNVLTHIRMICKPEDFVMLKVDIDHTPTEESIIQQILDSPELLSLIDEIYWEHHVLLSVTVWYGGGGSLAGNSTLALSYKMFGELRRRGIRAHSWV